MHLLIIVYCVCMKIIILQKIGENEIKLTNQKWHEIYLKKPFQEKKQLESEVTLLLFL